MKEKIRHEKTCGLYVRVSTDAQAEDGFSIVAQQERLAAYCTVKDWPNYKFYVDAGCSGSNLERPQMEQLIADVKAKKIQTIVVYKLDRLSRSQKDTLYLIEDVFMPHQVDFVSLNESIDTSTPYGRAMIGILSAFAQLERENIYLRTRMGMLERVKQGFWMGGGGTPYGYDYDISQGTLVPNENAATVRKIFDLYISGYSTQKIANMLDIRHEAMIGHILGRKTYTGVIPYNGEEYPGRHEAIISLDTFLLTRQKMKERSMVNKVTTHAKHLLSGMIWCGVCGARLRYIQWGKAGFKLRCYSQDKTKPHMIKNPSCKQPAVWAAEIEEIVIKDLFQLSVNMEEQAWTKELQHTNPLEELARRMVQCEGKLKRLYVLYSEAEDETLLETIEEMKEKLAQLQEEYDIEKVHSTTSKRYAAIRYKISTIEESWPYLTPKERQEVIRDCVSKVVITNQKVEIFYTFKKENSKNHVA